MRRSPFDFDISVSAEKRRRVRSRGMSGAFEGASRACEHPGCDSKGEYRAPKSRDDLSDFHWFCLDHVREYNRSWNFFEQFSEAELDAQMRADTVWGRSTWRMGEKPKRGADGPHTDGRAWARFGFADPYQVLGENGTINRGADASGAAKARARLIPATERRAIGILGMEDTSTKAELRARYRELVKDLHPDMNGGDRRDEGRLQEVLWAWDQLKESRCFPD